MLHALETQQALELLLDRLRKTKSNSEFLMQVQKTTPMPGNGTGEGNGSPTGLTSQLPTDRRSRPAAPHRLRSGGRCAPAHPVGLVVKGQGRDRRTI